MTAAGCYVYCAADGPAGASACGPGVRGSRVRQVSRGDVRLLWSEVDAGFAWTERDVLRHEAVVESAMARSAVLPMRFGTVLSAPEAVLEILERLSPRFRAALERVRGKVEVGVKVLWDAETLKEAIAARLPEGARQEAPGAPPGKNYLLRRFQEHFLRRRLEEMAATVGGEIDAPLRKWAAEAKGRTLATDDLLLSASYLVERDRLEGFKARLEEVRAAHPGLKFLFSGPWPPYGFAGI